MYLLARARERNVRCLVTGVLWFDRRNFMQYIEGPASGLTEVHGYIQRDKRHTDLIEMCREQPVERAFNDWAMCARTLNSVGQRAPDSRGDDRMKLLSAVDGEAGVLLREFWRRNQRFGQPGAA